MKKGLGIFVSAIVLWFAYLTYGKYSISEDFKYYSVVNTRDKERIKVGIIGDSWTSRQRLDSLLQEELSEIDVVSSSCPGGTSKVIYEGLFGENSEGCYSKNIIESLPQYCVVIVGVNDSFRGFGKDYYAEHTLKIIKTLLHYKIKPIVLEIPNYGIDESQSSRILLSIYRDNIWYFFKNENFKDIESYRKSLRIRLKEEKLEDKIVLIKHQDIQADYNDTPEMYADPLHLNKKGYKNLISKLVKVLNEQIESDKR